MEDLISQLPDDNLFSIISRIPTKEALGTTILSKRWKYLFRFVQALDFSCRCAYLCYCRPESFIEGVYGVLQQHCALLRSFKLCFPLTEPHTQTFEQCIHFLGVLGIEKLKLRLFNEQISFSCHLLSQMQSLEHFRLKCCSLQPNLKNPCNSLKTLKLTKVKAPPGSLECILSNCVYLCSFTIIECDFPSKLCFRGPNLQLKYIAIHECNGLEEIEFYASNLTTFEYNCDLFVALVFDYVPRLQNVYLCSWFEETMAFVCRRLGKDLPHLKTLVINNVFDLFKDKSNYMEINMFKFNNLKRLELGIYDLSHFNLFCMTTLVHGCPLLEDFRLSSMSRFYDWAEEENEIVLHSHLKNVEINGFGGSENETEFASYILKSAVKLQLMNISWYLCEYIGFGGWRKANARPLSSNCSFSEVNQTVEQLKHVAVSKTAQVTFQHFSQMVPKQF